VSQSLVLAQSRTPSDRRRTRPRRSLVARRVERQSRRIGHVRFRSDGQGPLAVTTTRSSIPLPCQRSPVIKNSQGSGFRDAQELDSVANGSIHQRPPSPEPPGPIKHHLNSKSSRGDSSSVVRFWVLGEGGGGLLAQGSRLYACE
jgi:hypothetical protein